MIMLIPTVNHGINLFFYRFTSALLLCASAENPNKIKTNNVNALFMMICFFGKTTSSATVQIV
ncbi:hypothetical protein [Mucilaginibacter glaciei]|uniref:Uncharacterized protein n=1 Tax=Mucilaginibacter glaciei TaxID=2772109 RepID=A0A926NQU0_9SPHI|nr:hypothetical protein [Mucilaginibacter glaciei]MBD1392160.1 hypothetical protein [Mucilaginibacter glaciei]